MVNNSSFEYNDTVIIVKKHVKHYVINVLELIKALRLENKSSRDMLRSGVPKETIVTVPIGKGRNSYYLKREGIVAFIQKYKPQELDDFINKFDEVAARFKKLEEQQEEQKEQDNTIEKSDIGDSYTTDLLEDILTKIEKQNQEAQRFYSAAMAMYTQQFVTFLEAESLYSKVAALLLRAESLGPIARINKELTRDMISLGKEVFSDALACDETLKEYDDFGKEEGEDDKGDKGNSNDYTATSRLLLRTDKKRQDSGKKH